MVAVLFLLQAVVGGGLAHYRVEPFSFYGFDAIVRLAPYNLLRTYHLQLAIFWIATAWVAGGLFLAPLVGGGDPPGQRRLVNVLFWALVLVVGGSLVGEFLGVTGRLGQLWFWLGHQGSEYLDLGRFWQLLLVVGLLLWLFLMFRALRPAIRKEGTSDVSALFLYAAGAIPLFYLPAVFYGPHTNFAVIDNWRFWIIHLWVEGFFELFATVLVAIMFRQIGLVIHPDRDPAGLPRRDALPRRGHHRDRAPLVLHRAGNPQHGPRLLLLRARGRAPDAAHARRLGISSGSSSAPQPRTERTWPPGTSGPSTSSSPSGSGTSWALASSASSSTRRSSPTSRWAPSSPPTTATRRMFGVFGMLGLGVLVFCLRTMQSDGAWRVTEKYVRVGYWGLNAGLSLMVVLDLFPAGVLQLWDVITNGYWHARQLDYSMSGTFHALEWVRVVGDTVFIVLGAAPIALAALWSYFRADRSAAQT